MKDRIQALPEDEAAENYYLAKERLSRAWVRLDPDDPLMRALLEAAERFLDLRFKEFLGEA